MTIPVVVIAALLFGTLGSQPGEQHPSASGGPLPVVTVSAPPSTSSATVSACAQVISELPLTLDGQKLRRTVSHPASGQVQAWGDPAIVFSCGVARPKSLKPGDSHRFQAGGSLAGPYYDVTSDGTANVWTTVDRAVYISVTIPEAYQGADVIPVVSKAIAKVLPAVCTTKQVANLNRMCTRRP